MSSVGTPSASMNSSIGQRRGTTRDDDQFTVNALILMTEVANVNEGVTRSGHIISGQVIKGTLVTATIPLQTSTRPRRFRA